MKSFDYNLQIMVIPKFRKSGLDYKDNNYLAAYTINKSNPD
jgi:hypothetical protein